MQKFLHFYGMKNSLFTLVALLFTTGLFAQQPKNRVLSLPVERNGITLRQPWVGGMNSPQFSPIDLNRDGLKDLYIFDRIGDKVLTYVNNGTNGVNTFDYSPKYEELFPGMFAWSLIRDYNKDGIDDIYTHVNSGIGVFKGRLENNLLRFDTVSKLLLYTDPPYTVNIWTNIADIPVITDVNFDGDMDILTYGVFGAGVEYFENQTKENPGNPSFVMDSFKFLNETLCWGNFQQSSINNSISLNVGCKGNGEGSGHVIIEGSERHAGNAIYGFDAGNDHDIDLLNGNIGFDNLMFLENGGDSTYSNITRWDSIFPQCNTPVLMPTYPGGYGVDVNSDGLEDVLIAPNVGTTGGRDVKNVMWYKNTGNSLCNFEYQSDSFLVADMLDFGTDSKPVFFDYNSDGLLDIIVGNYGYFRPFQTYKGTVAVYQNTGTATQPRYRMVSEDFRNFSSYLLVGVNPAFGDLDGDSYKDMITGELNGYLHFFKNTGGTVADFQAMTTPQYFNIDAGQFSAPFIYDLNGDSLLDILVGRKDGKLSYYWNMGTKTNPLFHKDSVNSYFGGINVTLPGYTEGYSQPFIWNDGSSNLKLFVGSNRGSIFQFAIDQSKLRSGTFAVIDTDFLGHDLGTRATIQLADLNGDGRLEYLSGNSRGGLILHSDSVWDPGTTLGIEPLQPLQNQLKVYPNPARDYVTCVLKGTDLTNAQAGLFNLLGEQVPAGFATNGNRVTLNTASLANGFYIVRIQNAGKLYTARVIIER
jgi:hypothetical protein